MKNKLKKSIVGIVGVVLLACVGFVFAQYYDSSDPRYDSRGSGYSSQYGSGYYDSGYDPRYGSGYSGSQYGSGYYDSRYDPRYDSRSGSGYYDSGYSSRYGDSYYSRSYGYGGYSSDYYDGDYYRGGAGYGQGYDRGYYDSYGGYGSYGYSNAQYTNPSYSSGYGYYSPGSYGMDFTYEQCRERMDFIMQIAPGGCSPMVVRSDLLEEQNVPVFCKVMAFQVNPLIDVSRIRSLRFTGEYPEGVSGVSYFPARAAVGGMGGGYGYGGGYGSSGGYDSGYGSSSRYGSGYGYNSFQGSPVEDNLGYLVVVLSRYENESDMPEYVQGNITAAIDYDVVGAYGVGNTNFYLSEMSEEEWYDKYRQNGFWNGRGYIRVESIEPDRATISVYRDVDTRDSTVTLRRGETSRDLYLGGYYCAAGVRLRLDDIGAPRESALLQVNDQQVWVTKGDYILDRRCRVIDIKSYAGGGKIIMSCSGEGRFELSLNPGKASFFIEERLEDYSVGEKLRVEGNYYLAYIGKSMDNVDFAVLIRDDFSDTAFEFEDKETDRIIENIVNSRRSFDSLEKEIEVRIKREYKSKLRSVDSKIIDEKVKIEVLKERDMAENGVVLNRILIAKDRDWSSGNLSESQLLARDYYEEAVKNYEDLADLYPNERMFSTQADPYAAQGLFEAAVLSRQFDMNARAQEFYNRLVRDYPDSSVAQMALHEKELNMKYDTRDAKKVINLYNEVYFISLLDFKKPSKKELSVVLLVDGKEETLELNRVFNKGNTRFYLSEIRSDYVNIEYTDINLSSSYRDERYRSRRIRLGDRAVVNDLDVKVVHINIDEEIRLSIFPTSYGPRTESNFTFRIGIEKRAIQLSPEQTKEMMENLIKAINEWNEINNKLGKVIKGMKAACFATSAILTVKNMLEGASGDSIARNDIMTNSGGWNDKCEELVNDGKYQSLMQCLLDQNSKINGDVNIYSGEIQKTNNILKDIQKEVGIEKTDPLDFQGYVDKKKVEDIFKKRFDEFCKGVDGQVTISDTERTNVSFGGEKGICNWKTLTHEQRRDIMTLQNTRTAGGSEVLQEMTERDLGRVVLDAKNYEELNGARIRAEEEAKKHNLGVRTTIPVGDKYTMGYIKRITKADAGHQVYGSYKEGETVVRVLIPHRGSFGGVNFESNSSVAGKEVMVQVKPIERGEGYISQGKIHFIDGREVTDEAAIRDVREYMSLAGLNRIKESNKKAYENPMLHPEKLKVKYFERAPYKGLPAEIPFDTRNGWYVKMNYVLSGFGKPYDESGRVVNYYICNVGPNGLIEFKQSSDDICRYYNGHSNQLDFPGMTAAESMRIVSQAQRAVADASRQYGKERVVINGQGFETGISLGGDEGKCTDFMSPRDCNIMFNVCDPVICPASRCDLGGRFRVDDVIQTGVVGSLVLCLPNFKEGILIPICLTGVHAGIDGYLSILNSTVDCLNESLETGRNVGICDEIKSIYLCEFFWKQLGPLVNVLVPRLFEGIYDQGVRGGGEYTTVQGAWDNTQSAINYFKNEYAVNSMRAFNARSTEDIGVDICKGFVSANVPATTALFDALTEPDSPVQYHAWFSENQLTTATVPPTSHYKVYYHIYAGKDWGAYYAVYLKDMPQSGGYIYSTGYRTIARGYAPRGQQVDEARDFTGPSGFKQVCISVNGKEECGFGKVSTSYVLNSLTDKYVEEQMNVEITSESECVAGRPSFYSLAQPNIQAGIEEVIEPQLYNEGIVRVCSTENPGKQVIGSGEYDRTNSTYDRWKMVGYCDDPTIKCWLDMSSVKTVVRDTEVQERIIDKVDERILDVDYWPEQASRSVADEAEHLIESLYISKTDSREVVERKIYPIVRMLQDLSRYGTTNTHKARGVYLLASLYSKVALMLYGNDPNSQIVIDVITSDDLEEVPPGEIVDESTSDDLRGAEEIPPGEIVDRSSSEILGNDFENVIPSQTVVFLFQDGTSSSDYYYTYKYNYNMLKYEWYWTNDLLFVWDEVSSGGDKLRELSERNQNFIRSLRDKSFSQGVELLAKRTKENSEEGWFASTRLDILIGEDVDRGKKPLRYIEIPHDDLKLDPPSRLVEHVLMLAGKKDISGTDSGDAVNVDGGEWTDDMLEKKALRVLSGKIVRNHFYNQDIKDWITTDEGLKDKSYVDGIVYIVGNMKEGDSLLVEDTEIKETKTGSNNNELIEMVFNTLKKS